MKTAKNACRETVVSLVLSAIACVAIGTMLAVLGASSAMRLASIPFTIGALLPAVYAEKSQMGTIGIICERHSLNGDIKAREQGLAMLAESGIISITPSIHRGPITFEITTLQAPVQETAQQNRCTLHKGVIHACQVACKRCGAVYCKACASELASMEEPCWTCHQKLEF
nr:hypothetical protein [Candidatus Sigynarchaeum springense]